MPHPALPLWQLPKVFQIPAIGRAANPDQRLVRKGSSLSGHHGQRHVPRENVPIKSLTVSDIILGNQGIYRLPHTGTQTKGLTLNISGQVPVQKCLSKGRRKRMGKDTRLSSSSATPPPYQAPPMPLPGTQEWFPRLPQAQETLVPK
jgi:hypothetical protein